MQDRSHVCPDSSNSLQLAFQLAIYDFELPFDPNGLRRNAMARGFSREEADVFAHLALMKLREAIANKADGEPVTALEVAQAIKQHARSEVAKSKIKQQEMVDKGVDIVEDMDDSELDEFLEPDEDDDDDKDLRVAEEKWMERTTKRFKFSRDGLEDYFGADEDPYDISLNMNGLKLSLSLKHHGMDLITAICQRLELAVELAKHLRPEDILKLYSISKSFHGALDGHLLSSIRQVIAHAAPEVGPRLQFPALSPTPRARSRRADLGGPVRPAHRSHVWLHHAAGPHGAGHQVSPACAGA